MSHFYLVIFHFSPDAGHQVALHDFLIDQRCSEVSSLPNGDQMVFIESESPTALIRGLIRYKHIPYYLYTVKPTPHLLVSTDTFEPLID